MQTRTGFCLPYHVRYVYTLFPVNPVCVGMQFESRGGKSDSASNHGNYFTIGECYYIDYLLLKNAINSAIMAFDQKNYNFNARKDLIRPFC